MVADQYTNLEDALLEDPDVERSTMMGLPCLRIGGEFFASREPDTGHLIVKLHEQRVAELIDDGVGDPFAPAGRVFREWVKIPDFDPNRWADLMREAKQFVGS